MTRADRLTALVERFAGAVHTVRRPAHLDPDTGVEIAPAKGGANYEIVVLPDGRRRLTIQHPETLDRISATGATLEDALADLEQRLAPRVIERLVADLPR